MSLERRCSSNCAAVPPVLDRLVGRGADDQQRRSRTQTPTIAKPRRRSAPFCFLRICVDDRLAVGLGGLLGHGSASSVVRWSCGVGRRQSLRSEPVAAGRDRTIRRRPAPRRTVQPWAKARAASGRRSPRRTGRPPARRRRVRRTGRARAQDASRIAAASSAAGGRRAERRAGRPGRPRRARTTASRAPYPNRSAPSGRTRAPRARAVVAGRQHQVGAAADDGERAAAELALGELGGAGDLVGDGRERSRRARCRGRRCGRRSPRRRRSPAAPIAMSVWPSRQARPAVSVTTTRDVAAGALAAGRRAARARRRRGPRAAARRCRASTLEASMPAAAMVRPRRVRTIVVGAAAGDDADGLAGQRVLAGAAADPALGLADDLAGHDDDVAVGELDQRQQRSRPGRRRAAPRARRRAR